MKRKISFVLVLSMILSIAVSTSVFAAKNSYENFVKSRKYENQFADVSNTEWYADSVSKAYEYGLVSGNSETTYNPTGNVSIAETIVLACRLNNIYCENNNTFDGGEKWYQPYVDYAIEYKIIDKEYADYNIPATRREFATILSKSLPKEAFEEINKITEIPDVSNEENNIYMLYNAGIIAGNDKYGTFNPTSNIQRSEVAAIIVRIADKTQRKTFKLEKRPVEVESVTLDKTSISMTAGEKETIKATISPDNATDKNISYSSSNTSVASVSNNGEIKALNKGYAIITATSSSGKTAQCNVSVAAAPIEFNGNGDKIIQNINIPAGDYCAEITHNGERHFAIKLYYGPDKYDYMLLANETDPYSGIAFLEDTRYKAINNGVLEVSADGNWTIKFRPISGTTTTNIKGKGDIVTGYFSLSTARNIFNITHDGERHFAVKIYYGTDKYDYELLANETDPYSGQAMETIEDGDKCFFVVEGDGNWTIDMGLGESVTTYSLPKIPTGSSSYNNDDYNYNDDDYSDDSSDEKNNDMSAVDKLVEYIVNNGKTEKGYKQIELSKGSVVSAITYRDDLDKLIFHSTINGSSRQIAVVSFDYDIEKEKSASKISFMYNEEGSGAFLTGDAKFDISSYTASTKLTYDLVLKTGLNISGTSVEDEKYFTLANSSTKLAVSAWNAMLRDKIQIRLSDIGFDSY